MHGVHAAGSVVVGILRRNTVAAPIAVLPSPQPSSGPSGDPGNSITSDLRNYPVPVLAALTVTRELADASRTSIAVANQSLTLTLR